MKINNQRRDVILNIIRKHHHLNADKFWALRQREKLIFEYHGNESQIYFSNLKMFCMLMLQNLPLNFWPHSQNR